MDRRRYLTGVVTTAALGLAGCGGTEDGSRGESNESASPGTTARTPSEQATTTARTRSEQTTETSPDQEVVNGIQRGETLTRTFDGRVQVREFGWTDEDLEVGNPGAAGIVENVGESRIDKVSVVVQFYAGDTRIHTNTRWLHFLAPGEYGRIGVPYIESEPNSVTRLQVSATSWDRIRSVNDGEVTLTDDGVTDRRGGLVSVTGTMENTTSETLSRVLVYVNFYNGQELLGRRRDGVEDLPAGESAEWSATASDITPDAVTGYTVVATVSK